MIRDMRLEWLKPGDSYPDDDGFVVTIKKSSLFSGEPEVLFRGTETWRQIFGSVEDVGLFVHCSLPENFTFSELPEPGFKLVGDPICGTSRKVYEYIGKDSGLDFRLGLTVHEARGTWSSEPHDFEVEALKSLKPQRFWEQFAYITEPANEWGIQIRRGFMPDSSWGNDMVVIRDKSILNIPLGVHMVTAAPGTKLAYIWVYQAEDISAAEKF